MRSLMFRVLVPLFIAVVPTALHAQLTTRPEEPQSLNDARKAFHTNIIVDIHKDKSPHRVPSTGPYMLVHFPSAVGPLAAYLTGDPNDRKRHPTVIWAHGGFGGALDDGNIKMPDDNDQTPHFFQEAGLVTMIPTWRGEGNNPGKPEIFCGEVDDLLSAATYVRTLPYVDPTRIYIVGHSSGGTLALLAAEASNSLRAVFDFGGTADATAIAKSGKWDMPFDVNNADEIRVRSAIHFVGKLKTPTFCIEGSWSPGGANFPQLQANADVGHAPLHTYVVRYGTHFNILHPLTKLLADKIVKDIGPTCNIEITPDELNTAFIPFLDDLAKARSLPPVSITRAAVEKILADANAAHMDPSKVCLRILVTTDDKVRYQVTAAHPPSDLTFTINGIQVSLDALTNRVMPPVVLDVDPTTQKLRMVTR